MSIWTGRHRRRRPSAWRDRIPPPSTKAGLAAARAWVHLVPPELVAAVATHRQAVALDGSPAYNALAAPLSRRSPRCTRQPPAAIIPECNSRRRVTASPVPITAGNPLRACHWACSGPAPGADRPAASTGGDERARRLNDAGIVATTYSHGTGPGAISSQLPRCSWRRGCPTSAPGGCGASHEPRRRRHFARPAAVRLADSRRRGSRHPTWVAAVAITPTPLTLRECISVNQKHNEVYTSVATPYRRLPADGQNF